MEAIVTRESGYVPAFGEFVARMWKGFLALFLFVCIQKTGAAPLFESEEVLEIVVEAPLRTLKNQRGDNPKWLEGRVIVGGAEASAFDVQVKARGNFRRKESSCAFPSYWINFKKKQVSGSVFSELDRVKVVAHCREGRKDFSSYIYKEYLAYKTYEILTDEGLRVRLARIRYRDIKSGKISEGRAAFFIEPTSAFAKRHGGELIEERYVQPSRYNLEALCRAELFQYLVGNSDFTYFASQDECCHNGKAFSVARLDDELIPVPYDFDLAGVVNTPYATVNPKLPIDKVTERFYRGLRVPDDVFRTTVDLYLEKEDEILGLWENTELLEEGDKLEALAFLHDFFRVLKSPQLVRRELVRRMRSIEKLDEYIENRAAEAR
ncbi:hypothetical protein [Pelagicoccus mobilis]|uniref:Uncharacterized protein n=1 Tax=Pelagicoccus mobilis TaxID=415221 RepID=A0A934RVJ2_9BACT|nr:hypothetical protein [Pelagicoccus mobilis]MBK1877607.1 hypothetical protein [Pelagicoccus mobilis]